MGGRDLCRTPSMQQRPRPTSDLTEGAQAGFILLPDLAAAAGTRENIDQSRPRGLIKGGRHAPTRARRATPPAMLYQAAPSTREESLFAFCVHPRADPIASCGNHYSRVVRDPPVTAH